MATSPATSCTSPSSSGTITGSRSPVSAQQPLDRRGVALGDRERLAVGPRDLRRELRAELLAELGGDRLRRREPPVAAVELVHAVDDQAAERHRATRAACGGRRSPPRPARAPVRSRRGTSSPGRSSSALTPSARSRKPSTRPPSARKKTDRSSSRSTPVRRLQHAEDDAGAAAHRARREAGRREEQLQRAAVEEPGQPVRRVEEVERVARRRRVEHEHVEAPRGVQVVELRDGRELLRAGDRAGELLVDPVAEDLVARLARRARAARSARRTCAWGRASSPTARRSSSTPPAANRAGSTSAGSLPSSSRPSASASRRAGSIVTTATRAPRAARPIAIAADVVVLPTPPEPAQITTFAPVEPRRRARRPLGARAGSQHALQLARELADRGASSAG